jgi:protein associated with RNAse G/E
LKKNKFNAKKTEYNGHLYDSKKEAGYAKKLDVMRRASGFDKVLDVERQVPFRCEVNGKLICTYKLDFKVTYEDRIEYIDVKGYKKGSSYQIFRIKKKLVEALFNIEITEV